MPKERSLMIEERGDTLHISSTGTNADGSPIVNRYTVPGKGGAGQFSEGTFDAVSMKRPNQNTRDVSFSKGGKVLMTAHSVLLADGKTVQITMKGTDPQGNKIARTEILEKQ